MMNSNYTDWKNYDRPAMMKATGEKTKEVYIILRESGSYFYTREDIADPARNYPAAIMDYYTGDPTARYFKLNFKDLTAEAIPAGLPKHIKEAREEARKRAEIAA